MLCIQALILWLKTAERQDRLPSWEPNLKAKVSLKQQKCKAVSFLPKCFSETLQSVWLMAVSLVCFQVCASSLHSYFPGHIPRAGTAGQGWANMHPVPGELAAMACSPPSPKGDLCLEAHLLNRNQVAEELFAWISSKCWVKAAVLGILAKLYQLLVSNTFTFR